MRNMRRTGPAGQKPPSTLVGLAILGLGGMMYINQEGMSIADLFAKFQNKASHVVQGDKQPVKDEHVVKAEPTTIVILKNTTAFESLSSNRKVGIIEKGAELPILEISGENNKWIRTRTNGLSVWVSASNVEFK
ncbi:MAG TPA: hypothetical protein DCL21_06150 [Alphaproteobacteria bacterium]|nr:hypothetical protein [Alphaproteobacteria bacterium]